MRRGKVVEFSTMTSFNLKGKFSLLLLFVALIGIPESVGLKSKMVDVNLGELMFLYFTSVFLSPSPSPPSPQKKVTMMMAGVGSEWGDFYFRKTFYSKHFPLKWKSNGNRGINVAPERNNRRYLKKNFFFFLF